MKVQRDGSLIYFDSIAMAVSLKSIYNDFLVWHLRPPIRRSRQKDPCRAKIGIVIRIGIIRMGRLLTKTHLKSKEGAYWKEGTKSNHNGIFSF